MSVLFECPDHSLLVARVRLEASVERLAIRMNHWWRGRLESALRMQAQLVAQPGRLDFKSRGDDGSRMGIYR